MTEQSASENKRHDASDEDAVLRLIIRARMGKGWTRRELVKRGQALGLSYSMATKAELGYPFSEKAAKALSHLLGLDFDVLNDWRESLTKKSQQAQLLATPFGGQSKLPDKDGKAEIAKSHPTARNADQHGTEQHWKEVAQLAETNSRIDKALHLLQKIAARPDLLDSLLATMQVYSIAADHNERD